MTALEGHQLSGISSLPCAIAEGCLQSWAVTS
jgi:hypothetical protein